MKIARHLLTNISIFLLSIAASHAKASRTDEVEVKIDSLTNISGASAMEACGTATHKNGLRPLWVTIAHDKSQYSTLTSPEDKWCVVIKRWTFNGATSVSAQALPGTFREQEGSQK